MEPTRSEFISKCRSEQSFHDYESNKVYKLPPLCDSFIVDAILVPLYAEIDKISYFELICNKEVICNVPMDILLINKNTRIIDDLLYLPLPKDIKLQCDNNRAELHAGDKGEIPFRGEQIITARIVAAFRFNYKLQITSFFYSAAIPRAATYSITYYLPKKIYTREISLFAKLHLCGIYIKTPEPIENFICRADQFNMISANEIDIKIFNNKVVNTIDIFQEYKKRANIQLAPYFCSALIDTILKYITPQKHHIYYFPVDRLSEEKYEFIRSVHRTLSFIIDTKNNKPLHGVTLFVRCKNILYLHNGTARMQYS